MPRAFPLPTGETMVEVIKTEEKGTDVNIASDVLLDCFKDRYEKAVIITNDSDLLAPIRIVQEEFGKKVGIINPSTDGTPSYDLRKQADFYTEIETSDLYASQFPRTLVDEHGQIRRPDDW